MIVALRASQVNEIARTGRSFVQAIAHHGAARRFWRGSRDECQAACPVLLGVGHAVAQAAETMEADGASARLARLALV
jgi:hypothetical protein